MKYEFRISRVLLPAVQMHFFPRWESKNCSRERSCQNPCQLLKQVFLRIVIPRGATHLPGIFSRHHLVIRRERIETHPEMLVCTWFSTKKLMNRTKNTLCQVLKGVGRLLSTAACVDITMWGHAGQPTVHLLHPSGQLRK